MSRVIFFLLLAAAGWWFIRGLLRGTQRKGREKPPADGNQGAVERMVTCAHCGVHLPESEALLAGDMHFCSDEHRRLGAS